MKDKETDKPASTRSGSRKSEATQGEPTRGRRVLVTGLGTFWGGRVAQALEADPEVDVIVGLDVFEPTVELERTEYVRVDANYSILSRIVRATQIDTIIHTFLVVDPTIMSTRSMHEINVIGTMNLFAAASTPDSTVRDVIVKSSTMVYGSAPEDPTWFTEESPRSRRAVKPIERSLGAVEGYVSDFATDNPHVNVALLRFSNVVGAEIETPLTRLLQLPLVPRLAGFDPRFQFIHERDVVRALLFAFDHHLTGIYNVAGDEQIPWSEVTRLCGRHGFPFLPYGTQLLAGPLRGLGILNLPEEYETLLKYGRGVDNSKFKEAGFEYEYTSGEAIEEFIESVRLRRTIGAHQPAYKYERDVEQFFRHSPAVVRDRPVVNDSQDAPAG